MRSFGLPCPQPPLLCIPAVQHSWSRKGDQVKRKETKSKILGIDEAEMSGRRCRRSEMLVFLQRVEEERHSVSCPSQPSLAPWRGRLSAWKASFQHSFLCILGSHCRKQLPPKPPRTSQLALSFSLIPRDPQGQRKGAGRGVSSVACGRVRRRAES